MSYVRLYKGILEFDWITLIDSLTVIRFSYGEKNLRHEPDVMTSTMSARWILKLDLAKAYIFRSAKSQRRHWCIRLEFDMSSVWPRE